MRLTEKDKRVIARAANFLVERMIDDPESLPAAEMKASSMIRALQKTYGDKVIRMALEKVMNQILEARKPVNKKKVNEMGRLSTIHAGGAERRAADATKIAAAKAKRAAYWTEDDVVSALRDFTYDFASKVYQQVESFVNEVNEDSKTSLIAYKKDVATEHLAKKGYLFLVGFSDSEDGESGSFNAYFGIGYPSILRNVEDEDEYCIIECDDKGRVSNAPEIAQFLNDANGQLVQVCYSTAVGDLRFFFEFENYEPMAKAGVWYDPLNLGAGLNVGDVIGTIAGKDKYDVVSALVSTDDLFYCLEQDGVFADWLMTGNWDPRFDPESGEYMEDEIDESVADFSSKTYVQEKF